MTVALPYPPPLHQNEGKLQKKNRNRKRFSCFFNNTTKGRTFQFLMTISMPARPPAPFKPLRMNVNRHYYIKTKKAGKINSHPSPTPKKKWGTAKNLKTKDNGEGREIGSNC